MYRATAGDDEAVVVEGTVHGSAVRAEVVAGQDRRPVVRRLVVSPASTRVLRSISTRAIVAAAMREPVAAAIAGIRWTEHDLYLFDVARLYVELAATRPDPLRGLAEKLGVTRNRARHLVWSARERGILTSLGRGISGGQVVSL